MRMDLRDYIKVFDNHLDIDLCKSTVEELKSKNWHKHIFYDTSADEYISLSGDKELDISYDKLTTTDEIYHKMGAGFYRYSDQFRFPFFHRELQHSIQRFNRYTPETKMHLHCDHIHSLFDGERKGIPILTGLVTLNDDYTGGQFIMWENTYIPLKQGSMVVFPSIFLYPHRVEPVVTGTRYSCVSWAF